MDKLASKKVIGYERGAVRSPETEWLIDLKNFNAIHKETLTKNAKDKRGFIDRYSDGIELKRRAVNNLAQALLLYSSPNYNTYINNISNNNNNNNNSIGNDNLSSDTTMYGGGSTKKSRIGQEEEEEEEEEEEKKGASKSNSHIDGDKGDIGNCHSYASNANTYEWSFETQSQALCAARILLREKECVEVFHSKDFIEMYLRLSQLDSREAIIKSETSLFALKCLLNSSSQNPDCIQIFVSLGGFEVLMKLLASSRPVSMLQLIVKILLVFSHFDSSMLHMIETAPIIVKKDFGKWSGAGGKNSSIIPSSPSPDGLTGLSILITTLAWCIRCQEPYPYPSGKNRMLLAIDILKVLYSIKVGGDSKTDPKAPILSRLGVLLCEILLMDNRFEEVYETKLNVVNLLTLMEREYTMFLTANGAIRPLCHILHHQVEIVVTENWNRRNDKTSYMLAPIFIVLNMVADYSGQARSDCRDYILPKDKTTKGNQEKEESDVVSTSKEETNIEEQSGKSATAAQMKTSKLGPQSCTPKFSLKAKLISLMTNVDPVISRITCEFMFLLCNKDQEELVHQCGIGNTINFLRIKGMIKIPGVN